MARKLPLWLRALVKVTSPTARDAEIGDIVEEYVEHGASPFWVCRQILSVAGPRRMRGSLPGHSAPLMSQIATDVRYALRTFRRHPGFAAAAIAPIALGVGLNAGVFSILDAIALQPVPSPDADELVTVYQDFRGVKQRSVHGARKMFSLPEYRTYRDATQSLTGLAAFSRYWTVTLGGDSPREITGALVTCNYFDVLRVRPALGAGFTGTACDAPGAPPAVVVTHTLWTTSLGSDREITGKTIALNGRNVAVVGVAPEGFGGIDIAQVSFFAPVSIQTVLRPEERFLEDPHTSWLTLVGRRTPGTTVAQVRAELGLIAATIDRASPGRSTTVLVEPARALSIPEARRDVFRMAAVVSVAFGLILLIACANVANLLLARAAARQKEIAVRLSLGAGRWRLVRQLLTESALIAGTGTIAGWLLARWSFRGLLALLVSLAPGQVPALWLDAGLNANVIGFAIAMTVATGLVFGLAPALQASRLDIRTLLNRDSAGAGHAAAGWLRGSLIGVQTAVCALLMICAVLLLRASHATATIEPGFTYRDVTIVEFDTRGAGLEPRRAAAFRQALGDRIRALPGVDAVAVVSKTPLSPGDAQTMVRISERDAWHEIDVNTVSPEYFDVVQIPITRGRTFAASDLEASSRAVIVTEATARRLWPGQNPVGLTLRMGLGPDRDTPLDVIGVAADAQVARIADTTSPFMYLPAERDTAAGRRLLVRGAADRAGLARSVREIARGLEPGLVVSITSLEGNLDLWRRLSRIVAGVSGSLSMLALVLATIGIYGVVSFVVSRRLREMGIRMTLGAGLGDVRLLIARQTLRPVAIGLAAGVAAAAAGSRVLQSVLFGVSPLDPWSFAGATILLAAVALAASLVPMRALGTIPPAAVLRRE